MSVVYWALLAAAVDPAEIMQAVARNMENGVEARRRFVYEQSVRARILKTNGQTARDERREYSAVPGEQRTEKKLESLRGEYHKSRTEVIRYTEEGFKKEGLDIDGELMEDLVKDLVDNKKSRDGIPHSLFPIRTRDLPFYTFTYLEPVEHKGRPAHRIGFAPKTKANCIGGDDDGDGDDDDDACRGWKGEAVIDGADLMPIRLTSDSTFRMPGAVRILFGTNLQQVGFNVNYTQVAPGVWFPATYGTEFRVDVLFKYKRVITLSLESKNFRQAQAESRIEFGPTPAKIEE